MRILVIGGGGREHALVWKLSKSSRVEKIYCVPGNPGIADLSECADLDIEDNKALCLFALENAIDLTVVGPEMPLANGVVDYFTAHGLKIFGPTQCAARIEGSKAFAKELMHKYNIPTAGFEVANSSTEAKAYIVQHGAPIVVKADGLAAGKGVVVAMTVEEALSAVDMIMCDQAFGQAGSQVVLEEYLVGEEVSLLVFTDGYTVKPMVAAQDHKRIYDGDNGPNTGGMGAYAPAPVLTAELCQEVTRSILQPVVDAMRQEGCIYRGCLYAGLIITAAGPKVIEFNARFGDPETQVVLPLLHTDLSTIMEACIEENLGELEIAWRDESAVCVVLAAGGYPGVYQRGELIRGIGRAENAGALVFHAGTAMREDQLVTNGGRILGVTAIAPQIDQAVDRAYEAVRTISFPGIHYRCDIAHRVLNKTRQE